MTELRDLGEFALLRQVVEPALRSALPPTGFGDDCMLLPLPNGSVDLAVSTDRVPRPLLFLLEPKQFWSWGWFSVAINLSDLAAAGARPLAFLNSVAAPRNMDVEDLEQFFAGIAACCREYNLWTAGGNLSSSDTFQCHGT